MQRFFYTLATLLLLDLAAGFDNKNPYPTFSPCNSQTLDFIKAYWNIGGTPHDVLQSVEATGEFILLHTSYDYYNEGTKCIYIKSTNGIMNISFVPKDGSVPANLTYYVSQDSDGVIRGAPVENDAPEFRWNWYSVFYKNGIAACYVCSDIEGSRQPPLADIMVAKDKANNYLTKTVISNLNTVLKGWGFDFRYSYGSQCILSGGNGSGSSSILPSLGVL